MAFGSIPFRPISLTTQASRRCFSRGGVIVRGTPSEPSQTISNPYPSAAAACPSPMSATAADHYPSPADARPLSPTARPFAPRTRSSLTPPPPQIHRDSVAYSSCHSVVYVLFHFTSISLRSTSPCFPLASTSDHRATRAVDVNVCFTWVSLDLTFVGLFQFVLGGGS